MRSAAALLGPLVLAVASPACAKDDEPFVIRVVGPIGEKPFASGSAARVELRIRNEAGERAVGTVSVSESGFEVPAAIKNGVGSVVLAGIGEAGTVTSYGRTPLIDLSGLTGRPTVNLAIFVQRPSTIAPALKLRAPARAPRCASIGSRYAVISDGEGTTADVLDVLDWTVAREDAFPTPPASLATAGSLVLSIDRDGVAVVTNLATGIRRTPTGLDSASFRDVAFGTTVEDESGGAWIVGATRGTTPSDVVLRFAPDGSIAVRRLLRARKSAAAAWVTGRGLLVAYGDASVGVELLPIGASTSTALAFPADPRAGGVVVALDGNRVLRIDPDGVGSVLDLTCSRDCRETPNTLGDDARVARGDDHAQPLEGSGAVVARGGRLLRVSSDGGSAELLHDAGANPVCTARLPNGSIVLAVSGDDVLRTIAPGR